MKTLIVSSLIFCLLAGCADKAMPQIGSEAIIYQELHHLIIEMKGKQTSDEIGHQIELFIDGFDSNIEQTYWTLDYQNADKAFIEPLRNQLLKRGVTPAHIVIETVPSTDRVIKIRVGQYKVKTQICRRGIFGEMSDDIGCYVESMRLKQVREPRSLVLKKGT